MDLYDTHVTSFPIKRHRWLIAPLLLAVTCVVLGSLINVEQWTDWFAHPNRTPVPDVTRQGAVLWRTMLIVAAVMLIAIPLLLTRLEPSGPSKHKRSRASSSMDLWIVTGLIVLGLLVRATRLGESLWYDEIAAWLSFGIHGPGPIIGNLYEPANHVAHTLLSWCAVELFERVLPSEIALRLPALLF